MSWGKVYNFLPSVVSNGQPQNWSPMQFGREVIPHARPDQGHLFNPNDNYPQGQSLNKANVQQNFPYDFN